MDLVIDSRFYTDGCIVEYMDMVVGFSHREGVEFSETLAPVTRGFSWGEGVNSV
jgi:hypothetical protein